MQNVRSTRRMRVEIKSYKKLRNNLYEVSIDQTKVNLYDDIIIKYSLLLKKEIDKKDFDQIIKENDSLSAYYKSLKYINFKLRSEKEIYNYLKRLNFNANDIFNTIERLKKDGYLDNKLYLKSYLSDQINLTNNGPYKIKSSLVNLGFKEEEINVYLEEIDDKIWKDKIKKIIVKRNKLNKKGNLKAKNYVYLFNLGYEKSMIYSLLGNIDEY